MSEEATTGWDRVATTWDASVDYVNGVTEAATRTLITGLRIAAGDRLVELAGGPGTLGAQWAELVGPQGTVIVSDAAPEMVAAANRRLAGLANVRTMRLELNHLALPEASADVVVCKLGLMFTTDPDGAVAQMYRVLAPDGRAGVVTWAAPDHNPWLGLIARAAPAAGIRLAGPPTAPGGVFALSEPERLPEPFERAGFVVAEVTEVPLRFLASDVPSHVRRMIDLAAPLAAAFDHATDDQLADVCAAVTAAAGPFVDGEGFAFPARALVLTATRR